MHLQGERGGGWGGRGDQLEMGFSRTFLIVSVLMTFSIIC